MENVKVKLSSGRVVELRPLSAREQMFADKCSEGDATQLGYYRTVMALANLWEPGTSHEGDPSARFALGAGNVNNVELERRIDLFSGVEIDELGATVMTKFAPRVELLKNSSSAPSESSLPPSVQIAVAASS